MKKTKIIATIGPSSKDIDILEGLMLKGMDIARINMKYATYDFCDDIISKIKTLNKKHNKNVSIMLDIEGPDVLINGLSKEVTLKTNDKIRIYNHLIKGDETKFSTSYDNIVEEVSENTTIKVSDGLIELKVVDKDEDSLICEVINGGIIRENNSLNIIDTRLNIPYLSKKDIDVIEYAHKKNIDFLALSLLTSAEEVLEVNDILIGLKNDNIGIIAKIETEMALDEVDEIIKVSDGVIIARGDLGIELPIERIPGIQKAIINKCHHASKVSIVATEMMSSMENLKSPTRAEVSDVANAILDGVDCVMLSGETTIGKYPVETVDLMSKIAESSEEDINYYQLLDQAMRTEKQDISGSIAYSVVEIANRLKCKAIITPTITGYTARKISRFRPSCPIIAISKDMNTVMNLTMYYGVYTVYNEKITSFDYMMDLSKVVAKTFDLQAGDLVIVTGGYPFDKVKHTNFMKVEQI